MKKFTEFLEKYCQWIAIGAGGLYLLWMVYSFVLTNTAWQIPVGNEAKSPGEVDEAVEQIANQLKAQIDNNHKVVIAVPDFGKAIDLNPRPMPEYAVAWANSPVQDVQIPQQPGQPTVVQGTNQPGPKEPAKIVELPKAPPATDLFISDGRSNVIIPPQVPVVALDPNNPQPQPQPQPVQQTSTGTDIDWITVSYKIPVDQLAKEFQRTMMPVQQQNTTCILDVQLMRQEMQPDGTWSEAIPCPKLTTATQPPFPTDNSNRQILQGYLNWAVGATIELVQPPFYQVVKGDPWTLSKDLIGNGFVGDNGAPLILGPNDTRPGFDPNTYVQMDPKQMAQVNPPLTNKEKQLIFKAKQDAKKANVHPPQPGNRGGGPGFGPGYGPGRGGPGGGDSFAPNDGYRPAGRPPAYFNSPDMPEGDMGPGMQQQQPSNFSSMFPLPQGEWDPRMLLAGNAANPNAPPQQNNLSTIVGWAHDWKPEPGKTYRYMIRYKIKNPVWATIGYTKDRAMADQFAITSVDSAWTEPIEAPPIVQFFFVSTGGLGRAQATVAVYKYENGALHKEMFSVAPGDAIGMEKTGIDYSTGTTLVDLHADLLKPDRVSAWLITPEGMLVKRDVRSDAESPQRQDLDKQIQAATPPAAAAAVGPGGAPAMINPTR